MKRSSVLKDLGEGFTNIIPQQENTLNNSKSAQTLDKLPIHSAVRNS